VSPEGLRGFLLTYPPAFVARHKKSWGIFQPRPLRFSLCIECAAALCSLRCWCAYLGSKKVPNVLGSASEGFANLLDVLPLNVTATHLPTGSSLLMV
jgi:hypothetical protein